MPNRVDVVENSIARSEVHFAHARRGLASGSAVRARTHLKEARLLIDQALRALSSESVLEQEAP